MPGTFQNRFLSSNELPSNHQQDAEKLGFCLQINHIITFQLFYITLSLHLAVFFFPESNAAAVPVPLFETINPKSNHFFKVLPAGFSLSLTVSTFSFCAFPTICASVAAGRYRIPARGEPERKARDAFTGNSGENGDLVGRQSVQYKRRSGSPAAHRDKHVRKYAGMVARPILQRPGVYRDPTQAVI